MPDQRIIVDNFVHLLIVLRLLFILSIHNLLRIYIRFSLIPN